MSYRITIQKVETITEKRRGEYTVIGTQPNGEPEYGYPPVIDTETKKDEKVYEQVVAELDLPAVIKAINQLQ